MSTYGYSTFTRSKISAAVRCPEACRSEERIIIRWGVILWPDSRRRSTVLASQPIASVLCCNQLRLLYDKNIGTDNLDPDRFRQERWDESAGWLRCPELT